MIINTLATLSFAAFVVVILRDTSRRSPGIAAVLFAYVAGLSGVAIAGFFTGRGAEFPPLAIRVMGGFMVVIGALLALRPTRAALLSIPTQRLVIWHWVRLPIGLVFVALADAEELAPEFGRIAGWGDVVIGLWAIAQVFLPALGKPLGTSIFNAAAFADMAAGVALATLTLASPTVRRFPARGAPSQNSGPKETSNRLGGALPSAERTPGVHPWMT